MILSTYCAVIPKKLRTNVVNEIIVRVMPSLLLNGEYSHFVTFSTWTFDVMCAIKNPCKRSKLKKLLELRSQIGLSPINARLSNDPWKKR